MTTTYPLAERFKAPQGEGLYAGAPMAFVRFVGCSVGQKVCTACDTDFDRAYPQLGGGNYTAEEIVGWAAPEKRVCLTGGEPLDRDLSGLIEAAHAAGIVSHIETSGTRYQAWLDGIEPSWTWICVSPKPGYSTEMVEDVADEIKVIIGGLGDGPGWPTVEDAVRWADRGRLVYVQPRNERLTVDRRALDEALEIVAHHPQLRLSVQLHKFLRTR